MEEKDVALNAAMAGLLNGVNRLARLASKSLPDELGGLTSADDQPLIERAGALASGRAGIASGMPQSPLQTVFGQLNDYNQTWYAPVAPLNPQNKDSLFPIAIAPDTKTGYANLWQGFLNELEARKFYQLNDKTAQLETLLALLQEFAWCAPSADESPDVSLFDQTRTTAAIAACLATQTDESQDTLGLLVGGDLSGLQAFIYTLASSGAAKSLRARSFYVQLISEALALAILRELDLPLTNLMYVGGGGFQLLAPAKAAKRLSEIVRDLTDRLLEVHQGGLGLTVKWEGLTAKDFERFNAVRDWLGQKINRAKRQPFAAASPKALKAAIGQPLTEGGNPDKFCRVTGEDGDNIQRDKDGECKSAFVLSLEALGMLLPKATHIALAYVDKGSPIRAIHWQQALRVFGLETQIVRETVAEAMPTPNGEFARVWRLEPKSKLDENRWLATFGERRVVSYRPFAKLTPTDNEERPLTFDDLTQPYRKNCAFRRWGVLRMDVDNLGSLFRSGFGEKASLARVASLSFALRLFFEGWLPQLAAAQSDDLLAKDDLRQHLYIQYSGGDDVFVVGAWDALPEFARRIRQSLHAYAVGNPAVTLSGGIAIVESGFPLYQAAEQADEAEKAAKDFKRPTDRNKDAITFLGQTLDWNEFGRVQALASRLATLIDSKRLSRSVPQLILMLRQQMMRERFEARQHNNPKPLYGRWTWLAAYQLTRAAQQVKKEEVDIKDDLIKLQEPFLKANVNQIESNGLAARWAQYLTRGG